MSNSSSNWRNCGCGQAAGMWTAWTIRNPGRRFLGCKNYRDEGNNCGYFRWFDPQLPNRWYREKMYELRGLANGEAIVVDGPPDAPFDFHVHEAPPQVLLQASENDNGGTVVEPGHNSTGFWKMVMVCLVCFVFGMIYG
ncbi:hypothetical protein LXL04_039923 [Taraxacum kok-saghyz]